MKQMMHKSKQKGFTLLELLVVITLLAVLSVGALVAYEGVGDNAQATAATNNTASVDKIQRTYRAVTGNYPTQYDNLSKLAGTGGIPDLADASKAAFGEWAVTNVSGVWSSVAQALGDVGVTDIQQYNTRATAIAPNLAHNEGANAAGGAAEMEFWDEATEALIATPSHLSILPNKTAGCTLGGADISSTFAGGAPAIDPNKINDSFLIGNCYAILALGFGHDAAHSTTDSSVAVANAPTYTSKHINPSTNYARYIALFQVGSTSAPAATAIDTFLPKARLIAVVDTEGQDIDTNAAAMRAAN